jgi:hypothetical protein
MFWLHSVAKVPRRCFWTIASLTLQPQRELGCTPSRYRHLQRPNTFCVRPKCYVCSELVNQEFPIDRFSTASTLLVS